MPEIAEAPTPIEEEKKTEQKIPPVPTVPEDVKFPEGLTGPAVFYDDTKFYIWIGIPLEKIPSSPVVPAHAFLLAQIDKTKDLCLMHLNNFLVFLIQREQQKKSPVIQRVNANLKETFQKGKSILLGR